MRKNCLSKDFDKRLFAPISAACQLFAQPCDASLRGVDGFALRFVPVGLFDGDDLFVVGDRRFIVTANFADLRDGLGRVDKARGRHERHRLFIVRDGLVVVSELGELARAHNVDLPRVGILCAHGLPLCERVVGVPLLQKDTAEVKVVVVGRLQAVHFVQDLARLRAAAVGDEKVQKPQVRAVVLRMRGEKLLIEGDRAVVVRRVPVEVRAVLGVEDGVVRLLAVEIQCERLTREGRGEVIVFPCALAVKLCEQQRRARARFLLAALFLQKVLLFVKFLLCEKALVPEHIVDAGKAALVREGEERVDARSQRDGQRGQKLNIGKRAAPFTYLKILVSQSIFPTNL